MKHEKMEYRLKKELDAARYAHTLGVEQTAREMARQFGEDEEKAALAGLLHDCAKCLPLSQMVKAAKDEKLDPVMKESKALCTLWPVCTSRRTFMMCMTRRCSAPSAGIRPGTPI